MGWRESPKSLTDSCCLISSVMFYINYYLTIFGRLKIEILDFRRFVSMSVFEHVNHMDSDEIVSSDTNWISREPLTLYSI